MSREFDESTHIERKSTKLESLGVTNNQPTELVILEDALELLYPLAEVAMSANDTPSPVFSRQSLIGRFRIDTFRQLASVDTGGIPRTQRADVGEEWDPAHFTVLTGKVYNSHLVSSRETKEGYPERLVRARYDGAIPGVGEAVGVSVEEGKQFKAASLALGQREHELVLWTAGHMDDPNGTTRFFRVRFNADGQKVKPTESMRTQVARIGLAPKRSTH